MNILRCFFFNKRLRGRSQNYNYQILIDSFSKHLLIFWHVPGIELGTGDVKINVMGSPCHQESTDVWKKNSINSFLKGDIYKENNYVWGCAWEAVSASSLPTLCSAHSSWVVSTTLLRLQLTRSLVTKSNVIFLCLSYPTSAAFHPVVQPLHLETILIFLLPPSPISLTLSCWLASEC